MPLTYNHCVEDLAKHCITQCDNVAGCDYADHVHRLSLQIQWAIEDWMKDVTGVTYRTQRFVEAAPHMLEALKCIVKEVDNPALSYHISPRALTQASDAIAKAEGRR